MQGSFFDFVLDIEYFENLVFVGFWTLTSDSKGKTVSIKGEWADTLDLIRDLFEAFKNSLCCLRINCDPMVAVKW